MPETPGGPCELKVAGKPVPPEEIWRYVLRYSMLGEPALYKMGKRLTCPWSFRLDLDVPADTEGGNANTEEGA